MSRVPHVEIKTVTGTGEEILRHLSTEQVNTEVPEKPKRGSKKKAEKPKED